MNTVTATLRARRPRIGILATAFALILAATPVAYAQEGGDEPETGVDCAADGLFVDVDDEGEEYYVVEPGMPVDCTATGLDDLPVEWEVAIYGLTEEDFDGFDGFDDIDAEPLVVFPEEGAEPVAVTEDGEATFSFTVPDDILFGWFEGEVLQFEDDAADGDEPVYEEYFDGIIFGDLDFLEGDMECAPDPAPQGGEVECIAEEMTEGDFDWEVYFFSDFLSDDELLDALFGDGDLAPGAEGSGDADANGTGSFSFEVPVGSDLEIYLAVAEQDDYIAFYAGEVGPSEPVDDDEDDAPEEEDADPVVTVPRPTRVDAGAGGAAPAGTAPVAALATGLIALAAVGARRLIVQGR
jgi:hypothetical protein